MAASYPGTVKTFTTKQPDGEILSAHINDLQNEIVAVETQLGTNAGTWQDWTPTFGAGTGMTFTSVSTISARYSKIGKVCLFKLSATGTIGGTPTWYVTATLPFNVTKFEVFTAMVGAAGNPTTGHCRTTSSSGNIIIVGYYDKRVLIAGDFSIYISGSYEVA